jgi:ankyrin repeat protein
MNSKLRNYFKHLIYLVVFTGFSISQAGSYEDFFRAIRRDDAPFINQLLQRGFDANSLDPDGRTGLTIALQEEYLKVSGALINWPRTDPNLANRAGETPLMLSAAIGDADLTTQLIKRGADVNKTGWTPLHYAASKGQTAVIRLLLDNSAYIDAESPNGTTPLMMAAMYGSPESVKLLIEEGADTSMKNQQGLTALQFATEGGRPDAIRMLNTVAARKQAPAAPARVQAPPPKPVAAPIPAKPPAPASEAPAANPYWSEPVDTAPRRTPNYWFQDDPAPARPAARPVPATVPASPAAPIAPAASPTATPRGAQW